MYSLWLMCSIFCLCNLVYAQSEGDVRLTGGTSSYFGRLDIFLKGKWGTFCGISQGGAQAACRQLGYLDAIRYLPLDKADVSWKIPKAEDSVPITVGGTSCDYSWSKGLLHVLRCGYTADVKSSCSHSNDIVLVCENIPLWRHPYNTQVRLNFTTYPSQGIVEIYNNQQWGEICMENFNQFAADSACRQLGYTNAKAFEGTSHKSTDVAYKSNGAVCSKGSCTCLSGCFKVPHSAESCKEHVSVQCSFDSSLAKKETSGSEDMCSGNSDSTCSHANASSGSKYAVMGSIIAAVSVVVIVVIVVAVLLICFLVPTCYIARKRRGYTPVK